MSDRVNESSLWTWLKKAKKEYRRDLHMDRLENAVGSGMPDVEGHLISEGQFWIELKACAWPKRETSKVRPKIREAQVEWIKRRKAVYGNVWLFIQFGAGVSAQRILINGLYVEEVHAGISLKRLREIGIEVKKPREVFTTIF